MKYIKYLLFLLILIIFTNSFISGGNQDNNQVRYYLIYDWIENKPLFEISENDITLYPSIIEETKGKDFISYKLLQLWDAIGSGSAGINISSIANFSSSYERNNQKSFEFWEFGNYLSNKNITFKREGNIYKVQTTNNKLIASSMIKDKVRIISYTDQYKNEASIEIDSSSTKEHIIKVFLNKQLTIYSKISNDLSNVEISSIFAGQVITGYKKNGNAASLSSLGSTYKAKIKDNITTIETTGRTLSIIKDANNKIISFQLISSGKVRYTKDIEYFSEYILIREFDVIEKILTETELSYDEIILYEVKKNIEDTIFYEYEYNPKTNQAKSNQYVSSNIIATILYDVKNGIKEIKEIQYGDKDNCETLIKFASSNGNISVKRKANNVFSASYNLDSSSNYEYYNDVKTNALLKKYYSPKNNQYKISTSNITIEKEINNNLDTIKENINLGNNININRNFSHKDYSYDSLLINNSSIQYKSEKQFRSGIGSKTITNALNTTANTKYNKQGDVISKKAMFNNGTSWNSFYGYNNGTLSVIRDIVEGVLSFITIVKEVDGKKKIITYDSSSNKVIEKTFLDEKLISVYSGNQLLIDSSNNKAIIQTVTNQTMKLPLISNNIQIANNELFNLENIEKKKYTVGKQDYYETIEINGNIYSKLIKDNKDRTYQKIVRDAQSIKSITIFGTDEKIKEATVKFDNNNLPNSLEIIRKDKKVNINISFNQNYSRTIDANTISNELMALTNNDKISEITPFEKMMFDGIKFIGTSTTQEIFKTGDFIISFIGKDSLKYYADYKSFQPIMIYKTSKDNFTTEIIFFKDFTPYAFQNYSYNGNKIILQTKDMLENSIMNQTIQLGPDYNIQKITTDAGNIGEYETEFKYYKNGLLMSKSTYNKKSNTKYLAEYIYGDQLSMNVNTFSIDNMKIDINLKTIDKNGKEIECKNYKYSLGNGLWYIKEGNTFTVMNKLNDLVDKQNTISLLALLDSYKYPQEFWWVYSLNL